jgi:hypothetical protein
LGNSEQICHNPTFENAAVEKRKCNWKYQTFISFKYPDWFEFIY